jgi:methionyl aminopeptidase
MLTADVLEKYERAGRIAAKVRKEISQTTSEGMPFIDICERTEQMIKRLGGKPAFPCNVSVNEVAAHYTSPPHDKKKVPRGSLVKIDLGVHVDGYIADTAITVCFAPELEDMVQASEAALEKAVKTIRPNMHTSELGTEIQRVIEGRGFKPISNLTGHQVGRYMVHTGRSLPNVSHISLAKIYAGNVYAIEPFVTFREAAGIVKEAKESFIFRFAKHKRLSNSFARQIMTHIENEYKTLPFTERWLSSYRKSKEYKAAFSELLTSKSLMSYHVFIEASLQFVAQSEHTVYVDRNGATVLT